MDIEAEKRVDFICRNAEVYFRAAKVMEEKIKENGQEELLNEIAKHEVNFIWIKGHNGHSENERCDALAVAQSERYKNIRE